MNFESLPFNLFGLIFSYLDPKSLYKLSLTNKKMQNYIWQKENLVKIIWKDHLGSLPASIRNQKNECEKMKQIFSFKRLQYRLSKTINDEKGFDSTILSFFNEEEKNDFNDVVSWMKCREVRLINDGETFEKIKAHPFFISIFKDAFLSQGVFEYIEASLMAQNLDGLKLYFKELSCSQETIVSAVLNIIETIQIQRVSPVLISKEIKLTRKVGELISFLSEKLSENNKQKIRREIAEKSLESFFGFIPNLYSTGEWKGAFSY